MTIDAKITNDSRSMFSDNLFWKEAQSFTCKYLARRDMRLHIDIDDGETFSTDEFGSLYADEATACAEARSAIWEIGSNIHDER